MFIEIKIIAEYVGEDDADAECQAQVTGPEVAERDTVLGGLRVRGGGYSGGMDDVVENLQERLDKRAADAAAKAKKK